RWGPRRIVIIALLLLGVGSIGSSYVQRLWHVYVTTGFLMALGAGGLTTPTGSSIAARWFEARRGLAIGLSAGGISAGQLVFIPLAAGLTAWFGWRTSYFWLGIGLLAVVLPIALFFVRDDHGGVRASSVRRGGHGLLRGTVGGGGEGAARRLPGSHVR